MLKISNLSVLAEGKKQVLHNINLRINPGETHLLQGHNGSGKSTLAATITGHPHFEVTQGKILLQHEVYPEHTQRALAEYVVGDQVDITSAPAHIRSLAGIFLAHQHPIAIPGLQFMQFLRLAYNQKQQEPISVFGFRKLLAERAEMINYPKELLERDLNASLSGGEKKKTEILQMLVLEPRYIILDETDSGLDKKAITDVFTGIAKYREQKPEAAFLLITHYDRVLDYLQPDFRHTLAVGKLMPD